jgi:hypothetical protein
MMADITAIQAPASYGLNDLVKLCNPPYIWWSNTLDDQWMNAVDPSFPFGKKVRRSSGPQLKKPEQRSTKRNSKKDTSLVRSDIWSHNGTELCQSPSSRGPDFISLAEGVHCDMDTRTVTPLCQTSQHGQAGGDCFSVDEKKLLGRSWSRKRSVNKQYSRIVDWKHKDLQERALKGL